MSDDELLQRAQGRVGTTLKSKYHIDRVLGAGGMAVVYAATHRNKKRVAIKMLHPELSIHGDSKQRFLREGYVANSVDHPGAVSVLDDDVADDGAAFIVMELLSGEGVETVWEKRGGKLPADAVLALADQLLAVLEAAHEKEIVHRDLKPANLFLLRDGTLKVLDFGIARLREAVASGPSSATQTGALLGTPAFLPPEQAGGRMSENRRSNGCVGGGGNALHVAVGRIRPRRRESHADDHRGGNEAGTFPGLRRLGRSAAVGRVRGQGFGVRKTSAMG